MSAKLRQQTTRLIVTMAAIFNFQLWSQDVSKASLQSSSALSREINVGPKHRLTLKSDNYLKLLKPLHGLTDSLLYSHETIRRHLMKDLKMRQITRDLVWFVKIEYGKLTGIIITYVDDTISTGDKSFQKESIRTEQVIHSETQQYDCFEFAGKSIERDGQGYFLHQTEYASRVTLLITDCTYEVFRARRHELAWLNYTRLHL